MTNTANVSVSDAAETLSANSVNFIEATMHWIAGNYVGILVAVGIGVVIALVMLGLRSWGHRLVGKQGEDLFWRALIGRVLAKTSLFFIVMCSAELVAENAGTPPALLRIINFLFIVSAAIQAAVWARELILGLIRHRVGDEEDGSSTLGNAMGLIKVLVTGALFAIAVVLILDNLGVNVTGLVAGLGIGGIAIGLAAQGIFSDLFSALAIIFDRPFRKGDTITFDSMTGTVENVGLKSTRIRSLGGEEVVVSNANLLDKQIQNWALLLRRRVILHFGVIYQTPPYVLEAIPGELEKIVSAEELGTFDRCHAFQFGGSSIDYELVFYIEAPAYADMMQTRQNIMLAMMRRFAEMEVEFAYPTQTTFTAAPDGKMIMPYPDVKMVATEALTPTGQAKR